MSRSAKFLTLRLTLTALGLLIILPRIDWTAVVPRWRPGIVWWLSAALLVTLGGVVLSALRWQRVLCALEIRTSTPVLLRHYLAGLFVSNFLPSTVGGDVLRVWRLSKENGERPATFASVVLERLTGWVVLPCITLFTLALNPGLLRLGTASLVAFLVSIGTLVLLVGVLLAAGSPKLGGRLAGNEGWLRFAGAVHLGLDRFRRHPHDAFAVLLVGLAYQLIVVLAAHFAARALGIEISPTAILAFMPAVAIVQVLPLTVGGLGIREGAFVLFLRPLGVATSQAVALGLLIYFINLAVSLIGAPAYAAGSRPPASTGAAT